MEGFERRAVSWGLMLFLVGAFARGSPALAQGVLGDDGRLAVPVSLACKDRPLGEILGALGAEIRVPLRAGRDTADDKATLLLDERPAAEVMALVARHFDFQWVRRGESYELVQSGESREREAALRRAELERQLAALYAEMEKQPPLVGTPRRQLEERESEIGQRLESEGLDEGERERLEEERAAVSETLHPGREPARAIFRSLTGEQIGYLLEGHDLWLSSADGTLPARVADLVWQAEIEAARRPRWRDFFSDLGRERWPPGETEVVVRLSHSLPLLLNLQPRGERPLGLFFLVPYGPKENRRSPALVGWSVGDPASPPEPRPPTETDDPALIAECGLRVAQRADAGSQPVIRNPQSTIVTLGDVAVAVREEVGLEVVADSFVSARLGPELLAAVQRRQPLVQILDRLAHDLDYRWQKEGNLLFLRSRTYYRDRPEEVPERILRPWRERVRRQRAATLDDVGGLAASLTDAQARGLELYWDRYLGDTPVPLPSTEDGGFYGSRHHLRLWASLTPAQRRRVFGSGVLPVGWMSPWQRQCFVAALEAPKVWLFAAEVCRPPAPFEIDTGGFGYRPPLPAEGASHTFVYYLAGEREPAREGEVEIMVPVEDSSEPITPD